VFVPNYDIHVARLLVAGCDVWLNTPSPTGSFWHKRHESCYEWITESECAGWLVGQADYVRTGWAIGHGENYEDPMYQDVGECSVRFD